MASEYGWSKDDILNNVYLDELLSLIKNINKRKLNEYQILLAIYQNPYTKNPNDLWDMIKRLNSDNTNEYDKVGIENLKMQLSRGSRIAVKG